MRPGNSPDSSAMITLFPQRDLAAAALLLGLGAAAVFTVPIVVYFRWAAM
jgi:hypothetical protein